MQIWRWMYQDGFWVSDLGETFGKQNGLSQKFLDVARLVEGAGGRGHGTTQHSKDAAKHTWPRVQGDVCRIVAVRFCRVRVNATG